MAVVFRRLRTGKSLDLRNPDGHPVYPAYHHSGFPGAGNCAFCGCRCGRCTDSVKAEEKTGNNPHCGDCSNEKRKFGRKIANKTEKNRLLCMETYTGVFLCQST